MDSTLHMHESGQPFVVEALKGDSLGVEEPLSISLQGELLDDFLVPRVDSISQPFFGPHKVAAII